MSLEYSAPIRDLRFVLENLCDLEELSSHDGFEDANSEMVATILEEAGKFASNELAPLNQTGDIQGARLIDNKVVLPEGFEDAYRQFSENGWSTIGAPTEYGGQGLPKVVAGAVKELWLASNTAFALCPLLTEGAVDALHQHGSEKLQVVYLPKLISGEWTGKMNLTEPQAGSDLSNIRTKAVPEGDHYRITGQKIFITWGDHEASENIIHLVLARLQDAPEGTRGISLFLVPKYIVDNDGSLGDRNDVKAVSVEHKLGIHASPTCVMSFGDHEGAIGYLVGEENKGLACMFSMMNAARLSVGVQGVAIGDRAYQAAVEYARERIQGSSPNSNEPQSIINHGDVQRMLMKMRALTEAGRAFALLAISAGDRAEMARNEEKRAHCQARIDLFTPIVKGWASENCQDIASLGIQVRGGMGYIEETGVAQYLRDARITTIYEGTTGIQALDLVGRKTQFDKGAATNSLLNDMRKTAKTLTAFDKLSSLSVKFHNCIESAEAGLNAILQNGNDPSTLNAIAVPYLQLLGTTCGAWMMCKSAVAAQKHLNNDKGNPAFYEMKIATTQFYFEHIAPHTSGYLSTVQAENHSLADIKVSNF